MVRVGGGWITLASFLDSNDPCRGTVNLLSPVHTTHLHGYGDLGGSGRGVAVNTGQPCRVNLCQLARCCLLETYRDVNSVTRQATPLPEPSKPC